ncbi:SAM-dependent methyltransferase [Nocardioides panacis]|uniref:SAM-dependent methyltransferase n=2 Tax=Nocardioides panacis TaxID=2849501 RepID=A0A975Y2P4_9ACTN|nr:SAM-dependent methyltransferase [Nocardioides panacis]
MRGLLLDDQQLVRAVASGRQKGQTPRWRRVELRYVDLKAGRRLQVTAYDDTQAHTSNHEPGDAAKAAVDDLLDLPFGNWHVETLTETHQLRVTKRLEAMVHTQASGPDRLDQPGPGLDRPGSGLDQSGEDPAREHDRRKPRLLPEDAPVLVALGISDADGRVKPSRQAKYRQVDEFLRSLTSVVDEALASGRLRTPTAEEPLRVVDLGCGNAYLTFAAHAYLEGVRGLPVRVVGIDRQPQLVARNNEIARDLGIEERISFSPGDIGTAELDERPDVVLALHACDTATDDALARAVTWEAPLVLAAPCCHHDIAAQLRRTPTPAPYSLLTRSGILRERFADTLTDAVRASVLRQVGYRVDVTDFVDSRHTPRNTLLRAVRTGAAPSPDARRELDDVVSTWGIHPQLAELLRDRLA